MMSPPTHDLPSLHTLMKKKTLKPSSKKVEIKFDVSDSCDSDGNPPSDKKNSRLPFWKRGIKSPLSMTTADGEAIQFLSHGKKEKSSPHKKKELGGLCSFEDIMKEAVPGVEFVTVKSSKKEEPLYLSKCCNAMVTTQCGEDFGWKDDHVTCHWQCDYCKKPCDVREPFKEKPSGYKRTVKKSPALEKHACPYNDGEQSCKCFAEGEKASHSNKEHIAKISKKMKVPADLLRLSAKDRKRLMLDAAKEATEMQREVMRKAAEIDLDYMKTITSHASCKVNRPIARDKNGACFACGLTVNGLTVAEEKDLAKEIKKSKKSPTGEMLFVSKRDAKSIKDILNSDELKLVYIGKGNPSSPAKFVNILNRIFNDSLKY